MMGEYSCIISGFSSLLFQDENYEQMKSVSDLSGLFLGDRCLKRLIRVNHFKVFGYRVLTG